MTGTRSSMAGWAGAALGLGLGLGRLARSARGVAFGRSRGFRGRVVVISGGSRGLGLILARLFAREGARVAICARDGRELDRVREELRARGHEIFAAVCDVSRRADVDRFVKDVVRSHGMIDVLVNNAGIIQVGPLQAMHERDFAQAMDVNFWGMVHLTLAALPHLARAGGGRIVNVTSIGGVVAFPHLTPYTCSKFACVGFSESLAVELRRRGIRVTTVVPGLMRTGSFLNALFKGDRPREVDWFALGATAPLISLDAERAARRMLEACRRGDPYAIIGWPAGAIRLLHALLPGAATALLSAVNRLLPAGSERDREAQAEPGWKHRRGIADSALTRSGDRAAARFNERRAA